MNKIKALIFLVVVASISFGVYSTFFSTSKEAVKTQIKSVAVADLSKQIESKLKDYDSEDIHAQIINIYQNSPNLSPDNIRARVIHEKKWLAAVKKFIYKSHKFEIHPVYQYLKSKHSHLLKLESGFTKYKKRYGSSERFSEVFSDFLVENVKEYHFELEREFGDEFFEKLVEFNEDFNFKLANELKEKHSKYSIIILL